jgi:hypothetical protein
MQSKAVDDIIGERQRLEEIGIPPRDRRRYRPSDLPKAAAAYALAGFQRYANQGWPELFWPWPGTRFRLGGPRDNLVRAAALILAEIERLDRLGPSSADSDDDVV